MSKFKVGDKVAHIDTPTTYFGRIVSIRCNNAFVKVPPRYDSGFVVHLDSLALYQEIPNMTDNEIYDMLKPKMDKAGVFMVKMYNSVKAIALAYRSGYLRAKKGRPFKIGGEKE